jgi:acetyl esterase/lipase
MNAPSHAALPKAILVTCGFDMLRDVGHAYAQKLAAAGNDITYVHYPELPHGFIQMTAHSRRCLQATQELARLLGEGLRKPPRPTTAKHSTGRRRREPVAE